MAELAFMGLPARRMQFINHMRSRGFSNANRNKQVNIMKWDDMQTATEEEKTTIRQQKEALDVLLRGEWTEQSENTMKLCLLRFDGAYRGILNDLKKGNYTDSALVELEPELEQCKLMSDFLLQCMHCDRLADRLKERWRSQPLDALNRQWLDQVAERRNQLDELLCTARRLSFQHLSQLQKKVGSVSYLKVRKSVGQEMFTDAKKAMVKEAKKDPDLFGHIAGKPLQFLNWVLRDKRKYHGDQNYEACKAMFESKLANIDSVLNDWQRGDEGLSPVIELKKYYSDPFKSRIRGNIRNVQQGNGVYDSEDEDFVKAIEALGMYAKIEGMRD